MRTPENLSLKDIKLQKAKKVLQGHNSRPAESLSLKSIRNGLISRFLQRKTAHPFRYALYQNWCAVMAPPVGLEPLILGQKHSRLARLERVAILLVSSCSRHPFFCHRQRDGVSQLTAGCGCYAGSVGASEKAKGKGTLSRAFSFGSPCWTRTNDPAVNSRMLYRLS